MKTYALEFFIVIIIIGLTVCLDVLYHVDHVKDNDRTKTSTGLERAHRMKHIIHEMHVMEDHHSMFVLTTGERKFVEPKGFSVQKVFGSDLSGVVAGTYDEGFGPKKWPEGARRVACGHVAIWKRIASECNGWCFVSEDDAKWPDVPLPVLPTNGFVSFFRSAVCNAATVSYSADYLRVVKSVVRGRCMPYGAVAYAMSSSFAKTLLSALPMKKPVDHFLWEQSVKHQLAFVARDYYVKHVKGKSLRESVANRESTSVKVVSPGPVKVSQNLKPIHISDGRRKVKCDVPCYWPENSGGIIKSLTIDELGIKLTMSMEGEKNHPSLRLSTKSSKRIFATTRFDSEIPMPYYDWPWTMYLQQKPTGPDIWSKNGIQTPHVPWESVSKAGVFIARNCKSKSGREKLVEELMTLLPVKSVSSCLNNLRLPPAELADKRKLMRQYAFYFAFENEITQDYITEKLWSTFGAGVLPVYFGAPNIKDHVPEHSIVNVADYDSRADLANHLKEILKNKDLYDSYHEWRYKPLPDFFVRKYNFTHVHSECRTCRWASAKLNGLKWDAEQQAVSYPMVVHASTRETKAKTSDYNLYKDVDQIGFDIDGEPTVSAVIRREITSVKIFASSISSGTLIKTVKSNNINEVAKECAEHPKCDAFERISQGHFKLMSGKDIVSGSHDVFVMREEPSCSQSVSPDLDLLIPSSGRPILCETLKSIECHSSYLTHCPNGPNVFIYGARAIQCNNVPEKCIRYIENAPPLEIKRGIATERQLQTSDFISLLNAVTGQGSVMLMDDDFLWCSEYVEYIQSAFENQFPIAFLGQGSNGMLMKKTDARGLAAYLTQHRASNNVDILQYRYAKSLGKCMARSEIRLSRHKGIKSSFARLENGFWVDDNFCGMPMMPKHVKNVFGVSWNQFYDKMWRTTGCKLSKRNPVPVEPRNPVRVVESKIPKIIHMTGRGHPNREYKSWKDKNPDWDVIWYSDDQVSNYVKEKYPEYQSTWHKMSKIARFDFWRILVVHSEGGLYVDSDVTCNRPIAEWDIRPGDKFISGTECWGCNDIELQLIQFAFMAVPEHPVLKYAMVHIATNAWRRPSYARHYENGMKNVFHSSGPGALTHGLLQYLFSRKHDPDCVTPYGRCEDVSVLPWWWWGYMDQHSKDHPATSKPSGSGGHYFLHGFRASWTHDKINQHATTEIIKEQPPKQIEPQGKFAYLFFATSTQHACAVETMVRRLIELGSSSSVDFVCVVPNDKIRFANNRIQKIVHTETQVQNDYFKFAMLKLYGFTMYKYDRIIHMDADSYVQKNLDHLFLLPDVPLAAPVANWENELCISGALLVIKPDRHTWQTKIQPSIASYARSGKSEMNLLNEVFEHRIGQNRILPELLILPSKYLTLSTEFAHPEPYHTNMADLWKETVVFHFSGGYGKPWAPKNVATMNDNTRKLYELARGDECAFLPKSHKSTSRKELVTRKEKSVPIDVQEFSCEGWDESSKIQWTKNKCTSTTFDMAVHLIPDIVSSAFKKYGCWEKTIVSRVIQHLNKSPYSLFLDVGANIGTFTTSAATQGHEVIAVEPFYLNIPVISSTICHHKYDNVHLYKVGLSDTSPGQKMCIWSTNSRINNGNARMTPYFEGKKDFGSDKQKECMEVIQTFTLDELLFDIYKLTRPISAMKIDIEGFETRAFRGAKRLLSSPFKPQKIWFEYQRAATIESGVPKNEIFETLSEAGYVITDFIVSSVPLTAPTWGNIHTGDLEATLVPVHDDAVSRKEKSVPNEPRIAVVVPTYNRRGYVKLCAKALSKTIDHNDIYVFDDHSDQFSTDDLQSWFGTTNVRQNEKRLKPDKQARSIVEWFVDTEYDWLVTLDSDLIVRPDWLSVLKSHLHLTEGVISLYHSSNVANHRTIGCENGICEMKSLGNAGVVWSRGLASKMLQTVSDGGGFDWGWSDWLRKNDVTQYAFEKSLVLHVGMHGTWGADSRREKSKGFDVSILSKPVQALAKLYLKGLHPDKENKYTRGVTPKFRIQRLKKG